MWSKMLTILLTPDPRARDAGEDGGGEALGDLDQQDGRPYS